MISHHQSSIRRNLLRIRFRVAMACSASKSKMTDHSDVAGLIRAMRHVSHVNELCIIRAEANGRMAGRMAGSRNKRDAGRYVCAWRTTCMRCRMGGRYVLGA